MDQPQRSAKVKMPDLVLPYPMQTRIVALPKQKQNGGGVVACSRVSGGQGRNGNNAFTAIRLHIKTAFRMRPHAKMADKIIGSHAFVYVMHIPFPSPASSSVDFLAATGLLRSVTAPDPEGTTGCRVSYPAADEPSAG